VAEADEAQAFGLAHAGQVRDGNADQAVNGVDIVCFQRIDEQVKAVGLFSGGRQWLLLGQRRCFIDLNFFQV
jgi:hypothetical protein